MAKKPDDIYKKEELPLFAQKGYGRKGNGKKKAESKKAPKKNTESSVYSQDAKRERKEGDELFKLRARGSGRRRQSSQTKRIRKIIWISVISLASIYGLVLGSVIITRLVQQRQIKQSHLKKQTVQVEHIAEEKALEEKAVAASIVSQIDTLIANTKASRATLNNLKTSKFHGKVNLAKEIKRLEETLVKVPYQTSVIEELALRYLSSEEPTRAISLALKLCEAEPQNMDHKVLLGRALIKSGDFPATLKVGEWLLESDPFSIRANGIMANAYLQMDKLEKAIQHLHKVVDIDSRNIVAQNNLGVAYTRIGQFDRAARIFEGILLQDEASSVTYFNLASCHAKADQPKLSIQVLQRASNHFGKTFIAAWLEGATFAQVKTHSDFADLQLHIPNSSFYKQEVKPEFKKAPTEKPNSKKSITKPLIPVRL